MSETLKTPKTEKIFIAKEWLVVTVMTCMMIVAWISISIYQILSKTDIAPAQIERLKEFVPVLDEVALQDLENRISQPAGEVQ